ncbi:MAG: hypothetical protein HY747_11940 [Elusimicrobia bacterium]|nr:hypothetical protein [Elusimicrobiota bacterium]
MKKLIEQFEALKRNPKKLTAAAIGLTAVACAAVVVIFLGSRDDYLKEIRDDVENYEIPAAPSESPAQQQGYGDSLQYLPEMPKKEQAAEQSPAQEAAPVVEEAQVEQALVEEEVDEGPRQVGQLQGLSAPNMGQGGSGSGSGLSGGQQKLDRLQGMKTTSVASLGTSGLKPMSRMKKSSGRRGAVAGKGKKSGQAGARAGGFGTGGDTGGGFGGGFGSGRGSSNITGPSGDVPAGSPTGDPPPTRSGPSTDDNDLGAPPPGAPDCTGEDCPTEPLLSPFGVLSGSGELSIEIYDCGSILDGDRIVIWVETKSPGGQNWSRRYPVGYPDGKVSVPTTGSPYHGTHRRLRFSGLNPGMENNNKLIIEFDTCGDVCDNTGCVVINNLKCGQGGSWSVSESNRRQEVEFGLVRTCDQCRGVQPCTPP